MIDLYYWTTPNCHKVTIFLEEVESPYTIKPVNISKGEQFSAKFLAIWPNGRGDRGPWTPRRPDQRVRIRRDSSVPYPQDRKAAAGRSARAHRGHAMAVLAGGRTGSDARAKPPLFAIRPEKIPYAIDRYVRETERLYSVLDLRLQDREFVAGVYSIADIATYPWIVPHKRQSVRLEEFPHLYRWFNAISARPAVERAYAKAVQINTAPTITEASRVILFGQGRTPGAVDSPWRTSGT
jgi:GST-like protein